MKKFKSTYFLEILTLVFSLLFILPLLVIIFSVAKTTDSISNSPLAFDISFSNFMNNITGLINHPGVKYPAALVNSLLVTIISVAVGPILAAMAAWVLVRRKTKGSTFIFLLFVGAMTIPFQVVMYPLVSQFKTFYQITGIQLRGTLPGLIVAYLGFMMPMTVFLYHGFIKSIPIDLEEAAIIDGCGKFKLFFKIVFPLMRPIYVTSLILNGIWIWNDYLLPFLIVGTDSKFRTIPLALDELSQTYSTDYGLQLAAILLAIAPVIILFLFAQRFIIEGMVDGSVK